MGNTLFQVGEVILEFTFVAFSNRPQDCCGVGLRGPMPAGRQVGSVCVCVFVM